VTILILGGTAEARQLAQALIGAGYDVLTSLAGRVSAPALPVGRVRIGGFGGVIGLADFLQHHQIDAIIDATHPFAAQISANAEQAVALTGRPLLRLQRPGWIEHPRAESWTWVPDTPAAREAADSAARPFLTIGRQSLEHFLPWAKRSVVARVVDPPSFIPPPAWTVIQSRGPYEYAAERQLMIDFAVDALLTKDSGGDHTAAKLHAAADLGIPVVIIARPPAGSATPVATVAAVLPWLASVESRGHSLGTRLDT